MAQAFCFIRPLFFLEKPLLRYFLLVSYLVWRAFCTEHAAAGPAVMPPPDQAEGAAAAHAERRHGVWDPGRRLLRPPLLPPVSLRLLHDPGLTGSDGQ